MFLFNLWHAWARRRGLVRKKSYRTVPLNTPVINNISVSGPGRQDIKFKFCIMRTVLFPWLKSQFLYLASKVKMVSLCSGMEGRRCLWPRGRAVGGTSVINYMLYTRGRPEDWDRIASDGNYGWSVFILSNPKHSALIGLINSKIVLNKGKITPHIN